MQNFSETKIFSEKAPPLAFYLPLNEPQISPPEFQNSQTVMQEQPAASAESISNTVSELSAVNGTDELCEILT